MGRARAAVVGSGFGGLAVAIRLAASGYETTIFEARDMAGGRAYVYRDNGFTFDAGPTVITAPPCLEELFEIAGERLADSVELLPVSPFYRLLWSDGDSFDYTGDSAQMIEQIRRRNPSDVAGYERFVDYSRRVFDKGYTELVAAPFLRFRDMVKVAPDLIRLRADRSVYSAVANFIEDEHLRQALSFHSLLVGGNPFDTSSIYTLIHYLERKWGVHFPRGGTGALIAALVALFERLGGEIRYNAPVRTVRLSSRRSQVVHLVSADREDEPFDLVVSNADIHHTYADLYREVPAANRTRKRLERLNWSMGLFVLYFGTNRTYRDDVVHHTVIFGPRYRELLDEIFRGASLPADYSLYLHAPTVTDPSLAPPGCDSFYVLAPVPHLGNAPLDWDAIGDGFADRILESLETVLPNVREHIATRRFMTPTDFKTELAAYNGSAFSCAPTLTQSAWFRPHNRDGKIPGLYIVGAGTHPGAGVPGVVNSAKATAAVIEADFGARA